MGYLCGDLEARRPKRLPQLWVARALSTASATAPGSRGRTESASFCSLLTLRYDGISVNTTVEVVSRGVQKEVRRQPPREVPGLALR